MGILSAGSSREIKAGLQPQLHRSAKGAMIGWDGRLDNRRELCAALHLVEPDQDCVVVGEAFDQRGEECFRTFVGDWAMSLWDPIRQELFFARDFLGVRHLFYSLCGNVIRWCNDLTCLVVTADGLTLSEQYAAGFLGSFPHNTLTPYREISSVATGSYMVLRANQQFESQAYWTFDRLGHCRYGTDGEYEEHYRYLFRQAVRRRLRTSVPVLAELSGGLDSSAITCMADSLVSKGEVRVPRIDTISFYDPDEPEDNDPAYFAIVEEHRCRTGLHVRIEQAADCLPFLHSAFEIRPGLGVNPQLLAAVDKALETHQYGSMLSGSGGDDFNGQALDPRIVMAEMLLDWQWLSLVKVLTEWSFLIRKRPWIQLFLQTLFRLLPPTGDSLLREQPWLNESFAKRNDTYLFPRLERTRQLWMRPSLRHAVELLTSRACQMTTTTPWRVERCYPFLDQDLVMFLISIPLEQLLRPGQRRSLMRRALHDLLPGPIVQRTTKAGLGRCFSVAVERNWPRIQEILKTPLLADLGYVQADVFRSSIRALRSGDQPPVVLPLLRALALEAWLRKVSARGIASVPCLKFACSDKQGAFARQE